MGNRAAIIEDFSLTTTDTTPNTTGRAFHDIVQTFVDHKIAVKDISTSQIRAYMAYLNDYVTLLGEENIGNIERERATLTGWLNAPNMKNGKVNSDRTRNCKLAYISAFYNWLKREKHVTESPCEYEEKRPVQKIRPLTFGQAEVDRVADALLERAKTTKKMNALRDYLLWMFFAAVGTRATETGLIRRADVKVNLATPMVEIRAETTKTGRGRWVPLPHVDPETWEGDGPAKKRGKKTLKSTFQTVLEAYWRKHVELFPPEITLFCTTTGKSMDDDAIRAALKPTMRACGIETGRVHDMRHFALTRLLEQDVSLGIIQNLAGHTTPVMTSCYAVPSPAAVAQLVNAGLERARKSA